MKQQSGNDKGVIAYTLFAWGHPSPYLRLVSPWQTAEVALTRGIQWDRVSTEAIASSELVLIHRDFPRLWSAYQKIIGTARALGKPVVFDLDDLILELPDDHPDRQYHYLSDALFPVLQAILEADAVSVSTPALRQRISPLNPNTILLPTCLDDRLWTMKAVAVQKNPYPLILGWINTQEAGGSEDGFVSGMAKFLRQQNPRVVLRVWGKKPPEELLQQPNLDWLPEIPPDYPGFASYFAQQNCDIFVVPHRSDAFYTCQSPLRFLEQAACGAPGIYSRIPPFSEVVEHRQNGMLVATAEEWEAALREMADSPALRQQLAEAAQKTVRQAWLLSQNAHLWSGLLEQAGELALRRKENQAIIDQVHQVANQARQWQRQLQKRLHDREWEVNALNVMMKRQEREAGEYIQQLGAQLQSIWKDPAWRLLHKAKRLVQTVVSPRSQLQPETPAVQADVSQTRDLNTENIKAKLSPARTFDMIYFASDKWQALPTQEQQFLSHFAHQGSRLLIASQCAPSSTTPEINPVGERIYELALPPLTTPPASGNPDPFQPILNWFEKLRAEADIHTALCWLGEARWAELAYLLRNTFGWKIVAPQTDLPSASIEDKAIGLRSDLLLDPPFDAEHLPRITARLRDLFPKVSLVILTYNNLNYTRQCLESIYAKTAYPNFEVIIVDNASTDGTQDYLINFSASHPNCRILLNPENRGFSAGNNQGVAASDGEYLVFLNNDVVVTPGWLSRLLAHLRDPAVGAVGPVTNFAGNESRITVEYSDIQYLDDFARRYCAAHAGQAFEIRMLALFCLATRKSTLEDVGPLDEQFGVGMYEDDDFSLRMRQKGYRILCAEDVYIHHWGSASFSQLEEERFQRLHQENRRKFEEKWGTEWQPPRWRMQGE